MKKPRNMSERVYKSYSFVDKDPVIHEVEDLIKELGVNYSDIEAESGVKTETLKKWFFGQTRRPQYATIRAVVRALGHDYRIVKMEDTRLPRSNVHYLPGDRTLQDQPTQVVRATPADMRHIRKVMSNVRGGDISADQVTVHAEEHQSE